MMTLESVVNGEELRQAMRHLSAGCTIITAAGEDDLRIGLVSNSFISLSLDPPLVLWSLAKSSSSYAHWMSTDAFSVHVLRDDDAHLVPKFAARGTDKFAGLETTRTPLGTPAIEAGHVRLDCSLWQRHDGGDHTIIIGLVNAITPNVA